MLASLRGDELSLASILEDAHADSMPLAVGLASQARTFADMTGRLDIWEHFLQTTVTLSADFAVDPEAHKRIARGEK